MDYHKNMKSYLKSKLVLFREILRKKTLVISDKEIEPYKIIKEISKKRNLKLLDINDEFSEKNYAPLEIEDFKTKNLLMAIEATKLCGLKEKLILKSIKKLKEINGRLELVKKFPNNIKVFIDYAHTPDALLKTLKYLKYKYRNDISLVFGCGGERDKTKRPIMAKIANKMCNKIYITDDNPRNESPKKIRNDLLKFIKKDQVFNIGNRTNAIAKAIHNADPQEIILIAGKGHEEKQIYKNKILNFSDKKIVRKIVKKSKNISSKEQNFLQNKIILKKIIGKTKKIKFDGFSIDTRTIKKGNLFFAIKGKVNDGNNFIRKAIKKGAGCIVTSSKVKNYTDKIIKVKNSISFLNNFAKFKRDLSSATIIAVTGSAGKTSLKNLINDLLNNY